MSERMSDEELEESVEGAGGPNAAMAVLWRETRRARASEEQKDTAIKALADALDGLHQVAFRGPDDQKGGPGQETYYNWRERIRLEAEDILRLVGRLP